MTRIARLLLRHFIRHAYRNAYHILKINGNVDLPAPISTLAGVVKQRARAADYTCTESESLCGDAYVLDHDSGIHLTAGLCEYRGEHRRIVIERVLVASRVNGSVPADDILEIYLHLAQHSVIAYESDMAGLAVAPARSHHRRRGQRIELSVGEHYGLIFSYRLAREYGIDDLISDYISHL